MSCARAKPTRSSVVAVELWNTSVATTPTKRPITRLLVSWPITPGRPCGAGGRGPGGAGRMPSTNGASHPASVRSAIKRTRTTLPYNARPMKKPGLPAELVRWRVAGGRLHAQREPAEPPGAGEVVLAVEGCSLGAAEGH